MDTRSPQERKDSILAGSREGRKVFTRLGQGIVVYTLSNGTYVVEFDHGGGHIFHPEELFSPEEVLV